MSTQDIKRVVIFGAAGVGKKAKEYYETHEGFEVEAFCDNDPEKWGTIFEGKIVISPEELVENEFDIYAIGIYKAAGTILSQLISLGIEEEKIEVPVKPVRLFTYSPKKLGDVIYIPEYEYTSENTKRYNSLNIEIKDRDFLDRIVSLKEKLIEYNIPFEKVCVVGGSVLQAYGKQSAIKFDDVDIIMTNDLRELYGKGLIIVSETAEVHRQNQYRISDDEIITNQQYHFIFRGLKFMTLEAYNMFKD